MRQQSLKSLGMTAAIIADIVLNRLQDSVGKSYFSAVELVSLWANDFEKKHRNTNWETVLNDGLPALSDKSTARVYSWDEVVMDFAEYKYQEYLKTPKSETQLPYYEFNFLSPDGITFSQDNFPSIEKAVEELHKWSKNPGFLKQGYYSSNNGKIGLEQLPQNCTLVVFKDGQLQKRNFSFFTGEYDDDVKIVNVYRDKLSQETVDYLKGFVEYTDNTQMGEDLFCVSEAAEFWDAPIDSVVAFEVGILYELCNEKEAALLRLI